MGMVPSGTKIKGACPLGTDVALLWTRNEKSREGEAMPKVIGIGRDRAACAPLKKNPRHLKGEARRKWNASLAVLSPEVATERQFDALTQYCEAWATYRRAIEALETTPMVVVNPKTGAETPSAWAKIRVESNKILFGLGLKLGLIPNGRDIPATDKTPTVSKFGGLLK